MDIIIEEAPDTITIQQEQFDQIATMVQAGVAFPPDVIIEASSLRNKKELVEKMNGGGELTPEEQQAAKAQAELQQRASEAEVAKLEGEAREMTANAFKTEQEAIQLQLENERISAGRTPVPTEQPRQ